MSSASRTIAIVATLMIAAPLLSAGNAEAKPKKIVSQGCTVEQIQAPSSSGCLDKLEQDIKDGVAYPHSLFCDETGVYCCQGDGTRTFGCKKVSALSKAPGSTVAPNTGTLKLAP